MTDDIAFSGLVGLIKSESVKGGDDVQYLDIIYN